MAKKVVKKSEQFSLSTSDKKKWLSNTLVFLAPALLIFLTNLQAGVPIEQALSSLYLWGINTLIDILKKYVAGK